MTPPASRIRPLRPSTRGRILLAVPVALCRPALPAAYGAQAEDPVALSHPGQVADRAGALGDAPARGGSLDLVLPLVVAAVVLVVAGCTWLRRRHRTATRTTPALPGWGGPPPGAGGQVAPAELDARAEADLVDTDDAVHTSEEELGFAVARYGEEAAAPFTEAVGYARAELAEAFRMRQRLDDAVPDDTAERRRTLDEIIRRCTDAGARLDAVSGDFDRLRALEETAPRDVAAAEAAFRELIGRVAAARVTLDGMRDRYAASARSAVAGNVAQAQDLLAFATSSLNQARRAVDGGGHARAAVQLRAAEGAIAQISTLVDGVERRATELAEAEARLPGALARAATEPAEAGGASEGAGGASEGAGPADGPRDGPRRGAARADAVPTDVREGTLSDPYDPVEALRRAVEAGTADAGTASAGAPERGHGDRRARALLEHSLFIAGSATGAAADYIGTRRGAVGGQARTRLAQARHHWGRARERSASDDPRAALAEARRADALAGEALDLAERDVRAFQRGQDPGGPPAGGGVGGAVLGGILLGGLFGGGGRGGFGGEGASGGPGSFGGGRTRGRRGGGPF